VGTHGSRDRRLLIERPIPLALLAGCLLLTGIGLSRFVGSSDHESAERTSIRLPASTATTTPTTSSTTTSTQTPTSTMTSTASPTTSPTPSPTPRATSTKAPRFGWKPTTVTAAQLGKSWHRGCPVGPSSLRAVSVRYWGFDAKPHTGMVILHRQVVDRTRPVFAKMFARRFPLRSLRPVSEFGGSDNASMAKDNTSAFNCRRAVAAGPPTWSRHAYGTAIDVNPVQNPYLFGTKVLPPAGKKFIGRSKARPGLIRRGDPIYRAFGVAGYHWGGAFSDPDYQHFDR
jgi:D-alanyl-D-alanine carboxypeptidase